MSIPVNIKTSPVFAWNYKDKARIKVNQGGTSSGKTYGILQVIFFRLIEKKRIATVVGQDIPNLKKGALRDFRERVLPNNEWMQQYILSYHKTDRIFTFKNGSQLEFSSLPMNRTPRVASATSPFSTRQTASTTRYTSR